MPNRVINLSNVEQFQAVNLLSDPGHIAGPVVVPNGVKVIIRWNLSDGKVAHNVLGVLVAAGFTATTAAAETARAALVAGSGWSTLAGFLAPGTALAGVDLLDIRSANLPLVSSTGAATPGTSAGTALPSETAVCVTIRTANTGPHNRGRFYIPGYATNAIGAGDVIAGGAVTATTGWLSNVLTAMVGMGTWALIQPARAAYVSPVTGRSFPARPANMAPQTGVSVRDNHWDSQRRRGLK